jgi:hypothetical protein
VTARGTYRDLDDILVRHEITILPVALALTRNRDGAVQLSNTAKYELALGDYTITAAGESYTLPPDTFLKPNATITLPPQVFAPANHEVVAVHDQAAQVVAYQVPGAARPAATKTTLANLAPPPTPTTARAAPSQQFTFASAPTAAPTPRIAATSTSNNTGNPTAALTQTASVINAIPTAAAGQEGSGSATANRPQNATAYLALIALLILAVLALLTRRVTDRY